MVNLLNPTRCELISGKVGKQTDNVFEIIFRFYFNKTLSESVFIFKL